MSLLYKLLRDREHLFSGSGLCMDFSKRYCGSLRRSYSMSIVLLECLMLPALLASTRSLIFWKHWWKYCAKMRAIQKLHCFSRAMLMFNDTFVEEVYLPQWQRPILSIRMMKMSTSGLSTNRFWGILICRYGHTEMEYCWPFSRCN